MKKRISQVISKFNRREIGILFSIAQSVYKSKELVILTAPCSLLLKELSQSKQHDFSETFGRILLITSAKVGNAPERNLLRRRSKAIFYQEKMFTQGLHYVAIFKKPATKLSYEQLKFIFTTTIVQKN